MNFVTLFFAAFLLAAVNAQNSKLDNFDIDTLLKNDRILNNYLKCILDKGPCTKEGRELKTTLPETLETNCAKCSVNQKRKSRKLINHLESKKPDQWKQLQAKYDPSGELTRKFKENRD